MAPPASQVERVSQRWSCGWPAPAKLHLLFHLTDRRAHGYPEVQTLLQYIDLGDGLSFRVRADGFIGRSFGSAAVRPWADKAVRAAAMLQRHEGLASGVEIAVTKQVPVEAGLAGSSSDAATTLVALNHLWGCGRSLERLAELGRSLAPEVAFFVRGHAAWAEGIGQHLTAMEPREPWYVVLVAPEANPSARVLGSPELTRDHPPITIRDFLAGGGSNHCLAAVRAWSPEVGDALDWLNAQGTVAHLCATGPSVFAAFRDEASARDVARTVPASWRSFVARGRNRSPLRTRVCAVEDATRSS